MDGLLYVYTPLFVFILRLANWKEGGEREREGGTETYESIFRAGTVIMKAKLWVYEG